MEYIIYLLVNYNHYNSVYPVYNIFTVENEVKYLASKYGLNKKFFIIIEIYLY